MEIVYVYIQSYKHLQQIQLNLSSLYNIELIDTTLSIKRRENMRERFFGNTISSIHGIVGKNGSGKSTIFEILSGSFSQEASFFIVMRNSNEILIARNNYTGNIECDNQIGGRVHFTSLVKLNKDKNSYLDPNLAITNFSTKFMIQYENVFSVDLLSPSLHDLSPTVVRNEENVDLLLGNMLKHSLNPSIEFTIEFNKDTLIRHYPDLEIEIEEWLPNVPLTLIEQLYFYSLIARIGKTPKKQRPGLLAKIKAYGEFSPSKIVEEVLKPKLMFPDFLRKIEKGNERVLTTRRKFFNSKYTLKMPKEILSLLHMFRQFLNEVKNYKLSFTYDILNLSQGEKFLYHFITQINSTLGFLERNHRSGSVLLIDEIEAFLHPDWCRNLVDLMTSFIYRFNVQQIQIIFSTHSPYILSDLPRTCITKLHRKTIHEPIKVFKDEKETFAANINDLLIDTFFMESTMGEFARKKINDVLERLNSDIIDERDFPEIEFVISIIGDPVIKKIVQKQYEHKKQLINPQWAIEEKIKQLENELLNLQKNSRGTKK
jgi:predicted ATPase